MTRVVLDDIRTLTIEQQNKLWQKLPSKLLKDIRNLVYPNPSDSPPNDVLLQIQHRNPLLFKAAQSPGQPTESFEANNPPVNETDEERSIISDTLRQYDRRVILEYCKIQESQRRALELIIWCGIGLSSINKIDKLWNKQRRINFNKHKMDLKVVALNRARQLHSIKDEIIQYAIDKAQKSMDEKFFVLLGRALSSKNKHASRLDRMSKVPMFIAEYWCGKQVSSFKYETKNADFPPLCFFSHSALATFCALKLGLHQGHTEVTSKGLRKWVSHLRLKRPRSAMIRTVKVEGGKIVFRM